RKYVEAVVVTGGEPCMHKELPKFLGKLKEHGFLVKLDTNGFYPETLERCLANVDYVAMDVKTSLGKYKLLGAKDTTPLMHSIELLKTGKVPYEFRTTVVPEFITLEDVKAIGEMVKGAKVHALQQFIPDDTLDKRFKKLKPFAPEVISEFAIILGQFVEKVVLRI
ncbi:MAG: radical SAM protein, partial [Betaproteobacteria bacterium]